MFCFGAVRQAGRMAQCLCGCLFCLICGGPILFIVGIVIIASPNTREDDIKEYNTAVGAYSLTASNDWSGGTISSSTISLTTQTVVIKGNDDDVDPASSRYATASVSSPPSSVSYAITSITPFTRSVTYSQSRTQSGDCQRSDCYSGTGVSCPSGATWTGPSHCDRGTCGTCYYTAYVSTYCVAVEKTGATWAYVADKCFYKNDAIYQSTNPSSVEFQVRQKGDPYIALQRITEGDDDFGITRGQQTGTGIALMVIGCIMIAAVCVVAFIVYKLVKKFIVKDDEPQQQAPEQQQYYNNNNNNNNAGGYGQSPPPASYGQPVQQPAGGGYGQPPPQQQPAPYYAQPAPSNYPQQQQPAYYPQQPQPDNGYGPTKV